VTRARERSFSASSAEHSSASRPRSGEAAGYDVLGDPRPAVTNYVTSHQLNEGTYPSLAALIRDIAGQVQSDGGLSKVPPAQVGNLRNDMYLASEAMRFLLKDKENDLSKQDVGSILLAWVLTLPSAIALSAFLFFVFRRLL
jgi:inorganic phosphate transporter, PiT family